MHNGPNGSHACLFLAYARHMPAHWDMAPLCPLIPFGSLAYARHFYHHLFTSFYVLGHIWHMPGIYGIYGPVFLRLFTFLAFLAYA